MRRVVCIFFCLPLLAAALPDTPAATPQEVLTKIRANDFQAEGIPVKGLILDLGMGELELTDGRLYVLGGYEQTSIEAVFIGHGTLRFTPPDDVEAGQLELFTGTRELDESITEISFATTSDFVVAAIRSRESDGSVDLKQEQRARERAAKWIAGYERELLGVEVALLHDAIADPVYDGFFAATVRGEDLEDFLLSVDPSAAEPVTLGQFVRLEMTEKEERRGRKALHKAQKKGRFIGVELKELGTFDTWVSSHLVDTDGVTFGGTPGFTPRHYEMAVDITREGRIDVTCKINLESLSGLHKSIAFELDSDLAVKAVVDASGNALFHYQVGDEFWVFLEQPVPADQPYEIEIRYAGLALTKVIAKTYTLRNPTGWYPRIGLSDLATYDVSFMPPPNYDLVASGKAVSKSRFRFDQPVGYFSFEMGDYDIEYFNVGDAVRVTIAWDKVAKKSGDDLEGLIKSVLGDVLSYYDKTLGDYPFDFLTVVTVPRDYAQSLPGFITLPSSITSGLNIFQQFYVTDPRMIIAHELAHQWWGHIVMFDSYRDQWISEAMASYSASAWVHASIAPEYRPTVDLTSGWWVSLNARTASQRTVDSLGPLVLGARLDSSHYAAYLPIVYKKGAVVLNTLAEAFGEENFLKVLNKIIEHSRGKVVSTDALLQMVERVTGQDLAWFRDRYIYGTGIPKVYYSYTLNEVDAGKWNVRVDLEQEAPFIRRYKLVRVDSVWDFEISTESMFDTDETILAIPVQIRVKEKEDKEAKQKKHKSASEVITELARVMAGEATSDEKLAEGMIVFRGTADTVDFDLPFEPAAVWLDRRSDVYGRFYDASRWPRYTLTRQAFAAENAGDYDKAARLYEKAIEAEYYVPIDPDDYDADDDKDDSESAAVAARVLLAEMYLRSGDHDLAATQLDKVEAKPKKYRRVYREEIEVARSRIDLGSGDYSAIVERLRKRLRGRDRLRSIEGYAVLAVAAHEIGDDEIYKKAAKMAEKNGVNIDALQELRD